MFNVHSTRTHINRQNIKCHKIDFNDKRVLQNLQDPFYGSIDTNISGYERAVRNTTIMLL